MWRLSTSLRLLIWTVALAVVAVRAGDTHLHWCFDGQEPPAAVHFADGSVHHDESDGAQTHADQDVDPFVGAFAKKLGDSSLLLAADIGGTVVRLPRLREQPAWRLDLRVRVPESIFHLRPPLRGPPA